MEVYRQFIGDTKFTVSRRGSYYDILANNEVISTHLGKNQAKAALKEWMQKAYNRIANLPAPTSVRSDVGKLIASIVKHDLESEFNIRTETMAQAPSLAEHYGEAAAFACVQRASFAAAIYSVQSQRTRQPIPDLQKQYFETLQYSKYTLPRGWQMYFNQIVKYAQSVARNAAKEGGVNCLWSR